MSIITLIADSSPLRRFAAIRVDPFRERTKGAGPKALSLRRARKASCRFTCLQYGREGNTSSENRPELLLPSE
jgi:hypothetical protein